MDKSPSVNRQEVDDGSWDLDENENDAESLRPLENLSSNSWDSASDRENAGRAGKSASSPESDETRSAPDNRETRVEAFAKDDDDDDDEAVSPGNRGSEALPSGKMILRATERRPPPFDASAGSGSDCDCDEIELCLPDESLRLETGGGGGGRGLAPAEVRRPRGAGEEEEEEDAFGSKPFRRIEDKSEADSLIVEDLEEPEEVPRTRCSEDDAMLAEAGESREKGYESDDASVWEIPISPRSETSEEESEKRSRSESDNAKSAGFVAVKCKSESNVKKSSAREAKKRSRSAGREASERAAFSLEDALVRFEGCTLRNAVKEKKKEDDSLADILNANYLGERPNHFQEIECMTLWKGVANAKEAVDGSESDDAKREANSSLDACCRNVGNVRQHAGTSRKMSEEAVSLPDIAEAGRSDAKKRKEFRKATSYTSNQNIAEEDSTRAVGENVNESWILLDDLGRTQQVTLTEVNFLLNGRSADAVLQENKKHFISKCTAARNASSDLSVNQWNPLVEESLQHFLTQEDMGGEETASKSIGLERKCGNMLLYIQSGINLASSVTFIPVDTEMIHMWRQSKDNVSPISSEDDARVGVSENITEETSDFDNAEPSEEMRCRVHDPYAVGGAMRKRRSKPSNKSDDYDRGMVKDRRIIDSLSDDVHQLKLRLNAERGRNSSLEQEIHRLRGQLDRCKNAQSSAESQKSSLAERYKKCDSGGYVPEASSSSVPSVDDFKAEEEMSASRCKRRAGGNDADADADAEASRSPDILRAKPLTCSTLKELPEDRMRGQSYAERKNFKMALDENLNSIEEILKCKSRSPVRGEAGRKESAAAPETRKLAHSAEETSRLSSSLSVNTFATVDTPSRLLSETTVSSDSSFKPKSQENRRKTIAEIINELENENQQLVTENLNLKKKLNEISVELDEYVDSSVMASPADEGKQSDSLRNQVCNLKLELENLKNIAKNKEQSYMLRDAIVREELAEKADSLEEWRASILSMFREVNELREKTSEPGPSPIPQVRVDESKTSAQELASHLRSLLKHLTTKVVEYQRENAFLKKSLHDDIISDGKSNVLGLDQNFHVNFMQNVPGMIFGNLAEGNKSEECRRLLSEKADLEEEMKKLRKENEELLNHQIEHSGEMQKMATTLRDEKSKTEALEKRIKIRDVENRELSRSHQKEKSLLESELETERGKLSKKASEVAELQSKLSEATEKFRTFDRSCVHKDEMIVELKNNCMELESRNSLCDDRIQDLGDQLEKLRAHEIELEEEMALRKKKSEEATKGMTAYILSLESELGSAKKNIAALKDKCDEEAKLYAALKKTYEELEKKHKGTAKMYNKARADLESCRRTIAELEESSRRSEEAETKAVSELNAILKSEMEKSRALDELVTERKKLDDEVVELKVRAENHAKAKDRLLKEQKDFINEISLLKKENDKLAHKYRSVKSECNERTRLLKHVDGKLRGNMREYNKRIACLERNVSNIVEKAEAFKDSVRETRTEASDFIRELQDQLRAVSVEKRDLESEAAGFHAAIRHLQREVSEKDRKLSFILDVENEKMGAERATSAVKERDESVFFKDIFDVDDMRRRLERAESAAAEAREKVREMECDMEKEKSNHEMVTAHLKSEIARYETRLEVMLKNISEYGKSIQDPIPEKSASEDYILKIAGLEQRVKELTDEVDKRKKQLAEMTGIIEQNEVDMRKKGDECDRSKERILQLKDEIKRMKSQFSKLQEFLATVNDNVETYEKERDEIASKFTRSLKLIVEERASKQSSDVLYAEKEKFFKDQMKLLKEKLTEKKKDYENLLRGMEDKKTVVNKLQDDVKKWKSEVVTLKAQVESLKEQKGSAVAVASADESLQKSSASASTLKELIAKNLELRKEQTRLQAKTILLEDDLRSARLSIKELEGDLRTERRSRKLLKEMIESAKKELDDFRMRGCIQAGVADKIERHFNLSEVKSRELFSDYRVDDSKSALVL